MNVVFRWIQISDLHFRVKEKEYNTEQIQTSLLKTLENLKKEFETFDALILTGDFRYAPDKGTNSKEVVEYIKSLANALSIDKKHIVTVPGNHDLERKDLREAVLHEIRSKYKPTAGYFDGESFEKLKDGFKYYWTIQKQLQNTSMIKSGNPHIMVDMGSCNLLLLNTALLAGDDGDDKKLILGMKYVNEAIVSKSDGKPIIAIGHHGLSYLNRAEERSCITCFEKNKINMYLCGHSHDVGYTFFNQNSIQVNCGCLKPDDEVYIGFIVGELFDNGTVNLKSYTWNFNKIDWILDSAYVKEYNNIYDPIMPTTVDNHEIDNIDERVNIGQSKCKFTLQGYTLIGNLGVDGIQYRWEKNGKNVESMAFNRRLRIDDGKQDNSRISAYTVSTSIGCELATIGKSCAFCGTGAKKFVTTLSAKDIALQCIFMAEYDSDCPSYPKVRSNEREFAFMGQGEPGFNYDAIREAILLTDYAMDKIKQKVSRYILSTCGIVNFMPVLIDDLKRKVYKNPVTIHFSLNSIDGERDLLMPINKEYSYKEFIEYCKCLYRISGVKIGVGILMFDQYQYLHRKEKISLTSEKLVNILKQLDKNIFRIDLCAMNNIDNGMRHQLSNEDAESLLDIVHNNGYEGKIFTSFGDDAGFGCGMLGLTNQTPNLPGNTTIKHFDNAVELLNEAINHRMMILKKL